MSGYLARLAARSHVPATETALRPSLRSTSPIAEVDARFGVDGFEGASPPPPAARTIQRKPSRAPRAVPGSDAVAARPPAADSGTRTSEAGRRKLRSSGRRPPRPVPQVEGPPVGSRPAPPPEERRQAGRATVRRPAVRDAAARHSALPRTGSAPSGNDRRAGEEPTGGRRAMDLPPQTAPVQPPLGETIAGPELPEPRREAVSRPAPELPRTPEGSRIVAAGPPAPAGVEKLDRAELHDGPAIPVSTVAPRTEAAAFPAPRPRALPANEGPAGIPRLEPPPSPDPPPQIRPPQPARKASVPEPRAPRTEVAAVESATPAAAEAPARGGRPLTAASASRIGPLRPAVRSHLLYGLRRR